MKWTNVGILMIGFTWMALWLRSSIEPAQTIDQMQLLRDGLKPPESVASAVGTSTEHGNDEEYVRLAGETGGNRERVDGLGGALTLACVAACGPAPFGWPKLELRRAAGSSANRKQAAPLIDWDGLEAGTWTLGVDGPTWIHGTTQIEIVEGRRLEHQLELIPCSSYHGKLVDATTLMPIESAEVVPSWRPSDQARGHEASWTAVQLACPNGEFCLTGPPEVAEAVQFRFGAKGYRASSTDWLPAAPGVHISDLIILLQRQTLGHVKGVVRDASSGAPVGGAVVCAVAANFGREQVFRADDNIYFIGLDQPLTELTESRRAGESGPPGEWSVDIETPASLRILTVALGYRVAVSDVLEVPAGFDELELEVLLERGAILRGGVLADGEPDSPRPTTIELRDSGGGVVSCSLGADLAFEFDGLDGGLFTAMVYGELPKADKKLPAVLLATQDVYLPDGEVAEVDIPCGSLRPGRTLHGRVLFPLGVEIHSAVGAACSAPELAEPCAVDIVRTDGTFALYGLPPDVERISIVLDGSSLDRLDRAFALVDVDLGTEMEQRISIDAVPGPVEIECGRGERCRSGERLRIVAAAGNSTHPWLPAFLNLSSSPHLEFIPQVRYRFFGMPAGEYRLQGEDLDLSFSVGMEPVYVLID